MIRAQGACFAAGVQGLHCLAQHGYAPLVVVFANRECVKDRGDAGRDYLGVVGEEGGLGLWPEHLGPWQEMLFQIVRVQLHKARHKVAALAVVHLGAPRGRPFGYFRNLAVADNYVAVHNLVFENNAAIVKNKFAHEIFLVLRRLELCVVALVDMHKACGHLFARIVVVEDANHSAAVCAGLPDELDHNLAVFGVQGGSGLVQKQDGCGPYEAAGNVHALLFAAGEGGGCQIPEPLGEVQAGKEGCRALIGRLLANACVEEGFGDYVHGADPGDDAQKLAHVADAGAAQHAHCARVCTCYVHLSLRAVDYDAAGSGQIVSVEGLEQGGLASARGAEKGHAFSCPDGKVDGIKGVYAGAALLVQDKMLAQIPDFYDCPRHGKFLAASNQPWSMEETRSWV